MIRTVVIGSGLAGLATALFLARRGRPVTVLERDEDDLSHRAEGAWLRRGVGQAAQTHAFLARSTQVLMEEAPDVLAALEAGGAYRRPIDLLGGARAPQAVYERRLAYEAVLRDKVKAEPHVRIELGREVTGLVAAAGDPPHVAGVRTASGDMPADLVVDATGRRSPAPRWLQAIGARPLVEEAHDCGFHYLTRWYRLRPGAAFPPGPLPVAGRTHFGGFILFPAGGGWFSISLTLSEREPHRHALRDTLTFDRFVTTVPRLAAWLATADGHGQPLAFGGIEDRRRSLVDAQGPVVQGFVLLGDAALHTNPTLGRGTSLGFAHAQQLARTVDAACDPAAFVAQFEAWTQEHLGEWFRSQVDYDLELAARFHALAEGRPLPPPGPALRRSMALMALAMAHPDIAQQAVRMHHLLIRPSVVAADASIAGRVDAWLDERTGLDEMRDGVTRQAFAAWAAQPAAG